MKMLILFTVLLAALCSAGPIADDDEKIEIDSVFFDSQFKIYSGQHEIINLEFPLNALNIGDDNDDDDEKYSNNEFYLFFTEADIGPNGKKDYKGLYVLHGGTATKLLENGRDSTSKSSNTEDKKVYFAASDGIYVYDDKENKAVKYGNVEDNFINIVQENTTDETTLFLINDKHEMYKVSNEGTKKEKVEGVHNAQQLVIDFENNIYFHDDKKEVYVINGEGVTKIKGLKKDPKYIQLVKPAFIFEDYVPVVLDDQVFFAYANGTSELSDFVLKEKPTGYGMAGTLIQFYAYNKKIYKYNVLEIVLASLINEVAEYFNDHIQTMQDVATRTRGTLRQKA